MLEDYLWELKVSCKRHWMSGHPGIVCVCMCVCVCERERERSHGVSCDNFGDFSSMCDH